MRPANTNNTVTRIIKAFNAPESMTKKDWEVTEAELETSLPSDYKELIDRMGGGYIDKYMYILEPNCRNEHYDLVDFTDERTETNATVWKMEAKPPELQIEGSFVIPWATTGNGENLFWRCLPGQHPDEWTVILNQGRDWTWEHHEMSYTDFLYAALKKEIQSEILCDSLPLSRHVLAKMQYHGLGPGPALGGHSSPVNLVSFSDDFELLAPASSDHTVGVGDAGMGNAYRPSVAIVTPLNRSPSSMIPSPSHQLHTIAQS